MVLLPPHVGKTQLLFSGIWWRILVTLADGTARYYLEEYYINIALPPALVLPALLHFSNDPDCGDNIPCNWRDLCCYADIKIQ